MEGQSQPPVPVPSRPCSFPSQTIWQIVLTISLAWTIAAVAALAFYIWRKFSPKLAAQGADLEEVRDDVARIREQLAPLLDDYANNHGPNHFGVGDGPPNMSDPILAGGVAPATLQPFDVAALGGSSRTSSRRLGQAWWNCCRLW